MKLLISSQSNHRGEIAYLGHGTTEAQARISYFEWLNKGLNPDNEQAPGGRVVDEAECSERLLAALRGPSESGVDFGDAMNAFNWATGSLYFNAAGLLDARHLSIEEFHVSHPELAPKLPAAQVAADEETDGYIDD